MVKDDFEKPCVAQGFFQADNNDFENLVGHKESPS